MAELDELNTAETPAETPKSRRRGKKEKKPDVGYVPGEQQEGIKEVFRIIRERRLLRKDLKRKGIKSRRDFEMIAQSMGLVLGKNIPFLIWWRHFWHGLWMGLGLKSLLAAAAALLALLFLLSYITEVKGSFTINMTASMLRAGYVLYDNKEFEDKQTRLFSERVENVNNITLTDIPLDVDDVDGQHNGKDYVAYTFYVRNEGEKASDYAWYVNFLSDTKEVGQCVWLMVFEDGNQVIYAERTPSGQPEELYGFREAPFGDKAYAYSQQYYNKEERFGLVTTPHVDEKIVAQGLVQNVEPGEAHKYTVVVWIEGFDPECTDDRFGGYAKYSMDFENVSEEDKDIFYGVYRTEYKDYGMNPDTLQ